MGSGSPRKDLNSAAHLWVRRGFSGRDDRDRSGSSANSSGPHGAGRGICIGLTFQRPIFRILAQRLSRLGLAALLMAVPGMVSAAACRPDTLDLRWPGGQARFAVELAETPAAQAQGLMFRERMAKSAGMLFIFPAPKHATFWMKNTLIPLDMLFIDEAGRVTHIHPDAVPKDLTPIDGGEGVKFVLEINGGLAARLRLPVGAEMRHPAIAPDRAAWPCEATGN